MRGMDENALHLAGKLPADPAEGCGPPIPIDVGEEHEQEADDRPLIRLTVGDLHRHVEQGIAALAADPDLYERDHALVHVTRATRAEQSKSGGAIREGTPKIHSMAIATLKVRLCKWARWERPVERRDGPEWVACEPSKSVVEGIGAAKQWPGLRSLRGIIEAPSLRPDGTVLDVPGFDEATGYLYTPSGRFLRVAERPTHDDARRAFRQLAALFDDFPYAVPAGQSMAVAAALTLLARPAIEGPTPAFIFDATTPGSGKTLQIDVCSGIATGREASRQHFPFVTGRDRDTELSKVLSTLARRGAALVNFDNLDAGSGAFGGSALEMCLTVRDTYTFRILGKTEGLTVPWRTVVFGSGNNVEWTRDMERRILVARLESPYENPEDRPLDSYKHPELRGRLFEHVIEHRPELVHAGLTLLRAYFAAGSLVPSGFSPLPTFEEWSNIIVGALLWVGAIDPLLCRPSKSADENPDKAAHRALVCEWDAFCRASGLTSITAHQILGHLYPKDRGAAPPDPKWETLRGAVEFFAPCKPGASPDPATLGRAIAKLKGAAVRVGDRGPLRRFALDGASNGRARWKVEDAPQRKVEAETAADPAAC